MNSRKATAVTNPPREPAIVTRRLMVAGVETGGTKVVVAVADADAPGRIIAQETIPTGSPTSTIALVGDFLGRSAPHSLASLGLASFGPIDPRPGSSTFGFITSSPKRAWANFDVVRALRDRIGAVPVSFVTDVTGAAIGEAVFGAGRGVRRLAYLTIGTGVGAGILIDGEPLLGSGYPEVAHLGVKRHPMDSFAGVCPFHGDCAEGLMSGPAIEARFGPPTQLQGADAPSFANELVAFYAAQVINALSVTLGIERVVVGGGVTKRPGAFELLALQARRTVLLGGGVGDIDVVAPELGDSAGVMGALHLASQELRRSVVSRG